MKHESHAAGLRAEPPGPVRTLPELFAVAAAMEAEAAARYTAMAVEMQALGLAAQAEVFRRLAAAERGHAEHVRNLAEDVTGALPDPANLPWLPEASFDLEEAQAFAAYGRAPAYRALSLAVRNEDRSFAFWSYVAAQATEPEVQQAAERLAREELLHAAMLRQERRRAFHAERPHRLPALARATEIEARLAVLADSAAAPTAEYRQLREDLVEAYLEAADAATDEAEVTRLQAQAEAAIRLVVALRRPAGAEARPTGPERTT